MLPTECVDGVCVGAVCECEDNSPMPDLIRDTDPYDELMNLNRGAPHVHFVVWGDQQPNPDVVLDVDIQDPQGLPPGASDLGEQHVDDADDASEEQNSQPEDDAT